jgi:hypothetical protein
MLLMQCVEYMSFWTKHLTNTSSVLVILSEAKNLKIGHVGGIDSKLPTYSSLRFFGR